MDDQHPKCSYISKVNEKRENHFLVITNFLTFYALIECLITDLINLLFDTHHISIMLSRTADVCLLG